MSTDRYVSPLSERYASKEMQFIFSPDMKFQTWRKLWIALAETEKELGLKDADGNPRITDEQIEELKAHVTDINYDVAKAREKEVRHDVMSHVYAYGKQCPKAAGIIHHNGCANPFKITDNTISFCRITDLLGTRVDDQGCRYRYFILISLASNRCRTA